MTSKRQEEKWVAGGEKGNEGRWGRASGGRGSKATLGMDEKCQAQ